jgi:hypothetical protein
MEILGRLDPGMDWGAPRRVVARSADGRVRLFIREGHSVGMGLRAASSTMYQFARLRGPTYVPTALVLQDSKGLLGVHLAKGRITNATLRSHRARLEVAFGAPLPPLDVRWTTVVG